MHRPQRKLATFRSNLHHIEVNTSKFAVKTAHQGNHVPQNRSKRLEGANESYMTQFTSCNQSQPQGNITSCHWAQESQLTSSKDHDMHAATSSIRFARSYHDCSQNFEALYLRRKPRLIYVQCFIADDNVAGIWEYSPVAEPIGTHGGAGLRRHQPNAAYLTWESHLIAPEQGRLSHTWQETLSQRHNKKTNAVTST